MYWTPSFNLAVEQQLTKTISGRLAYVGSLAFHQINPTDINPVWNQGPNIGKRVYSSTVNQQNYTNAIATVDTGGLSNYHSLQVSLQDRISNTLSAFINYTWSKSIDNNAFGSSVTAVVPGSSYVLPVYLPNYKRLDDGPADYDHRNVLEISYVWLLPKFGGGNAAVRYLLNGWQTNGIFPFRSGDPLTVTGANVDGTGLNRDRAVWNGLSPYGGTECAAGTHCKKLAEQGELLDQSLVHDEPCTDVRQCRKGQLRRTAVRLMGHERDPDLPDSRVAATAVPRGVLQCPQPHELWRSATDADKLELRFDHVDERRPENRAALAEAGLLVGSP